MRPYPEELQRAIQNVMVSHFGPELTTTYSQRELGVVMLLFSIAQRDYDSAVPDLIDQNTKLRMLLSEAAAVLPSVERPDAQECCETIGALPAATDSLRLSTLRAENDALRGALSMLSPIIEPAQDDASLEALRPLRVEVYAHLRDDAKRRSVPMLGG